MKIPKIIHQVYENLSGPPESWRKISESWRKKNPDWEYIFWTKPEMEDLVKEFPDFEKTYFKFPFNVQRWDAIRYLILFKYGGLYVDMDYECLKNIDQLFDSSKCVLGLEPQEHAKKINAEYLPGNAFMASEPKHPFWLAVIDFMKNIELNNYREENKVRYILETTGPFMINNVYEAYNEKGDITLISDKFVAPLSQFELFEHNFLNENNLDLTPHLKEKIDKAYAIHYFFGGWYSDI